MSFKTYLVDSDIIIDLLRAHPPALDFFGRETELQITCFSLMELLSGARDKVDQARLVKLLTPFPVLYPTKDGLQLAVELFQKHRLSKGTGLVDALIAGTAISAGAKLFTRNSKHFKGLGVAFETPY